MHQMMRQQTQDYAKMRALMQQMQSQRQHQRTQQTLTAMLHTDANDNRRLDYPGVDRPYQRDGQPVTANARITL